MNIGLVIITICLSIFSTGVMSYIALATPIGPWIAPTLVLIGTFLVHLIGLRGKRYSDGLALVTAGGSIGGILATALSFSFPTLYFLDQSFFGGWMESPIYFVALVAGLSLAGGSFGLLIADLLEHNLIVKDELPFPIGQLVYKMIAAQNQARKALELAIGACATFIFTALHGGTWLFKAVLASGITLTKQYALGPVTIPLIQLRFDVLPMLLAIGFITGHVIAIPLIVGAIARIGLMEPINNLFFPTISGPDFLLAFGSGLVAVGAVQSFFDLPKMLRGWFRKLKDGGPRKSMDMELFAPLQERAHMIQAMLTLILVIGYLSAMHFSVLSQFYLIILSFVCAYQIVVIAGKIGLAQLGRFATFVMVPALFLFGVDPLRVTVIATFVELCGGVATDVLFGRKMGQMAGINRSTLRWFQILGLIVSSIAAGVIMWLLVHKFGLGGEPLVAQRAQARALLINVSHFNWFVLIIGGIFGLILKKCKLNPMLVLGGLLMPFTYSIGLIIGGCLSFMVKDREEWEPFWSGVFAANSITELAKTLM
ncbi:MAG TPA: OPT/YSL family transporter [Candidatus Babeliales bacterium]|nr:OPT/YSL family transporter [Candidatus Babeliales bacterium]